MFAIINKVPHPLTIITNDGKKIVYPASKNPIRLNLTKRSSSKIIGGELFQFTKEYAEPHDIEALINELDQVFWCKDNYVVVSRLAQESLPFTYEFLPRVLSPGNLIRKNGEVVGAIGFTTRILP